MTDLPTDVKDDEAPLAEGLYLDVHESRYHNDPAPEPSLSASAAKVLLKRSARAFQWKHPRLRPDHLPAPVEKYDSKKVQGQVLHKLVLGRGKDVVPVDAAAWNTKAAKEERAAIHAHGKLAVLAGDYKALRDIAAWLQSRTAEISRSNTEMVGVWLDRATDGTPVWCRMMVDIWDEEACRIDDLKLTQGELTDAFVGRQIAAMDYDLSMAWYRRGMSHLRPELAGRIKTRVTFIERNEPYDIFPADLLDIDLAVPDRKCQAAIDIFARCMTAGEWPGIAQQPRNVVIPPWHERQWLDRELSEEN